MRQRKRNTPAAKNHWRSLQAKALHRCGSRCERCRAELPKGARHLHHLTYERAGHELLSDVQYLCLACHGAIHHRPYTILGKHHPNPPYDPQRWMEENGRFLASIQQDQANRALASHPRKRSS